MANQGSANVKEQEACHNADAHIKHRHQPLSIVHHAEGICCKRGKGRECATQSNRQHQIESWIKMRIFFAESHQHAQQEASYEIYQQRTPGQ